MGILNMEFGAVSRAASHFERVAPNDPHADLARRALERLRGLQTTTR